jgi:hypothetical protein
LNARHATTLRSTYDSTLTYFGESRGPDGVVTEQLSALGERFDRSQCQNERHARLEALGQANDTDEASPCDFLFSGRSAGAGTVELRRVVVDIDQFRQLTATVTLAVDHGAMGRTFFVRINNWNSEVSLKEIDDLGVIRRAKRCTTAVGQALNTLPNYRRWRRKVASISGFDEPLRDGVYDTSEGENMGDRLSIYIRAHVAWGQLSISVFSVPVRHVPAKARDLIRRECLRDDDHCASACKALGQCEEKGNRCVAAGDVKCRESQVCKNTGACFAGGRYGECIAKSTADCNTAEDCVSYGGCSLESGVCEFSNPDMFDADDP